MSAPVPERPLAGSAESGSVSAQAAATALVINRKHIAVGHIFNNIYCSIQETIFVYKYSVILIMYLVQP